MSISNSTDRFNGVLASLAIKTPCAAVSDVDLVLSGEQTVNGVAVVGGDRVLVIAQTNPVENGIYDAKSTAWQRAADFDGNRDVVSGTQVSVATANIGRNPLYQVVTQDPITIGTTAITFSSADGPNVSYALTSKEATDGLTENDINDAYEPGHVYRYGTNAVPGTTDMTVAVNRAITAMEGGLGRSYAPGDIYLISSSAILKNRTWLEGDGIQSTQFKVADGMNDAAFRFENDDDDHAGLTLAYFQINGNRDNQTDPFALATLSGITKGNPTTFTTSAAHGFASGQLIDIAMIIDDGPNGDIESTFNGNQYAVRIVTGKQLRS